MTAPAAQAVITIVYGADGQINVSGPLNQPVLCYGMLRAAEQAIAEMQSKGPSSPLALPPGVRG